MKKAVTNVSLVALAICLYGLMAGLCSAWFARGLSLKRPSRYPQVLGAVWLRFSIILVTPGLFKYVE